MMIFAFSAAALLALASGGPDPDANPAPRPSPTAQEVENPSMEQRYCVYTDTVNSRIRRTICRTREQWIALTDFDPAKRAAE